MIIFLKMERSAKQTPKGGIRSIRLGQQKGPIRRAQEGRGPQVAMSIFCELLLLLKGKRTPKQEKQVPLSAKTKGPIANGVPFWPMS